jgi:hypothetical protein
MICAPCALERQGAAEQYIYGRMIVVVGERAVHDFRSPDEQLSSPFHLGRR